MEQQANQRLGSYISHDVGGEVVRAYLPPALPPIPAVRLDEFPLGAPRRELWRAYYDWHSYTVPFNVTGQPALSLPIGTTAAGLPVGLQIVGALGADALVLALGAALERARA